MKFSFVVVIFAFFISGCAAPMKPYAFHVEPFSAQKHVEITGNPGFGQGVIVILKLDGQETRTSSMISPETRKANENLLAPNSITVSAGKHKLGVVYLFTDVPGKLVTAKMVNDYEKMYLPVGKRDYVTVKHYEEFDLDAKIGMSYKLGRVYDENKKSILITVSECGATKKCKEIPTEATNIKNSASEGWANPSEDLKI